MFRIRHFIALALVVLVTVASLSAVALQSPLPGHLLVENSLVSDGHGNCTGSASLQYGTKLTDVASGWRYDTDSSCNIVGINWLVGSPLTSMMGVAVRDVSVRNSWAIDVYPSSGYPEWWKDAVTSTTTFTTNAPCSVTPTAPVETEAFSALSPNHVNPAPATVYSMVGAIPESQPCSAAMRAYYACQGSDTYAGSGPANVCANPFSFNGQGGKLYGVYLGPEYMMQRVAYTPSGSVSCQTDWSTEQMFTEPTQGVFYPVGAQCDSKPSNVPINSWDVDPSKVFTTVTPGNTVDFTVN